MRVGTWCLVVIGSLLRLATPVLIARLVYDLMTSRPFEWSLLLALPFAVIGMALVHVAILSERPELKVVRSGNLLFVWSAFPPAILWIPILRLLRKLPGLPPPVEACFRRLVFDSDIRHGET